MLLPLHPFDSTAAVCESICARETPTRCVPATSKSHALLQHFGLSQLYSADVC